MFTGKRRQLLGSASSGPLGECGVGLIRGGRMDKVRDGEGLSKVFGFVVTCNVSQH